MTPQQLEQQRAKNQIDKELVRLLEQRMDVVAEIAAVKKKAGHAVLILKENNKY